MDLLCLVLFKREYTGSYKALTWGTLARRTSFRLNWSVSTRVCVCSNALLIEVRENFYQVGKKFAM